MLKKVSKKVVIVSFIVTFVLIFLGYPQDVKSSWETSYEQKKSEVQNRINNINSQLNEVGNTVGELNSQKESLKEQISQIESDIAKTNDLITETKLAISEVEDQIQQNETKITELKSQMKSVFRSLQRQSDTNTMEMILSSESFGEAINKVHNLSAYEVEISELKQQTEKTVEELNANKEVLKQTQDNLEAAKALNKSKQDQLNLLLEQTEGEEAKYQSLLHSLSQQQANLKTEIVQIDAAKEAEAKARESCTNKGGIYKTDGSCYIPPAGGGGSGGGGSCSQVNETLDYSGIPQGYFIEPTSGYITNSFGCKTAYYYGKWWNHDGADVANGVGTTVKAAASGTVRSAGCNGGGYGCYVIIKHVVGGRRIYTMYAHLKGTPPVSTGQAVTQGQVIGYIGMTGNTTGPHLHFSIADESYESTGSMNCNKDYGYTATYCFDPFGSHFDLW